LLDAVDHKVFDGVIVITVRQVLDRQFQDAIYQIVTRYMNDKPFEDPCSLSCPGELRYDLSARNWGWRDGAKRIESFATLDIARTSIPMAVAQGSHSQPL
jgi:hypothetical protein